MRPADGNGLMASSRQKLLSPEKLSEFLDVQGFALEHNSCEKLNKTPWSTTSSIPGLPNPLAALTPLDKADYEFRLILQAFNIYYIPIPHPRPSPSLRPGFGKYIALETAGEPERGFEGVNTALRYYGNSTMFPAACPAEIQAAVDVGQAKYRRLCEEAVAGNRAYHKMVAQG
ncbi:hypothetical protein QBC32DRAFT_352978 [Pseudoneurospora amorphoporcata]|uniref:Uncharacterized protein n=1 Tax=Pseudoneurospora amorphoporcata TaxID=241081 RepID=A0AAN6NL78_9PEZI|nr:hypothetical protein QBC32DRAFT_352978 [Pseudoneurospora amorphoporcata]